MPTTINTPEICEYCGEPVTPKRGYLVRNGFGYALKHPNCSMDYFPIVGMSYCEEAVIILN